MCGWADAGIPKTGGRELRCWRQGPPGGSAEEEGLGPSTLAILAQVQHPRVRSAADTKAAAGKQLSLGVAILQWICYCSCLAGTSEDFSVVDARCPDPALRFDARDLGAEGDGVTNDQASIQQAIDRAALHVGGGVSCAVHKSLFTWLWKPHCAHRQTAVTGWPNARLWGRVVGVVRWTLVAGVAAHGSCIVGEGVLDGQAQQYITHLRNGRDADQISFSSLQVPGQGYVRPGVVSLANSENISVEGVTLMNGHSIGIDWRGGGNLSRVRFSNISLLRAEWDGPGDLLQQNWMGAVQCSSSRQAPKNNGTNGPHPSHDDTSGGIVDAPVDGFFVEYASGVQFKGCSAAFSGVAQEGSTFGTCIRFGDGTDSPTPELDAYVMQMPGMQFMGRPPLGMPMGKGGLGMLNGMGMMPGMQGMMQGMPGMQGQMVMPPLGAPGNPGFQLNGCKGGGKDGGKFGGKDFGGKDGGKFGCGKDGGKFGGKDGGKGMMGNDNGEQSVADALVSALNALGPPPSGPCGCGPPPGMPGMTGPRPNGMGSMPGMMMQLPPGMLPPPPGILPPGMMPGMMPPPPGMMPPGFMNMPMPPGFDGQLTVPILPPGGQEGGAVGGKQFPWEGTSGVQCKYARACKNSQCTDEHLDGRDIDKDPNSTICRFGRKCKRQGCFFVHPQGRDIDDDPSKGMCRQGIGCKPLECMVMLIWRGLGLPPVLPDLGLPRLKWESQRLSAGFCFSLANATAVCRTLVVAFNCSAARALPGARCSQLQCLCLGSAFDMFLFTCSASVDSLFATLHGLFGAFALRGLFGVNHMFLQSASLDHQSNYAWFTYKTEASGRPLILEYHQDSKDYKLWREDSLQENAVFTSMINTAPRIIFSLYPPSIVLARFNLAGTKIFVSFDLPTLRGAIPLDSNGDEIPDYYNENDKATRGPCSRFLDDFTMKLIPDTMCQWTTDSDFFIEVSTSSTIAPGDLVRLRPGTIYASKMQVSGVMLFSQPSSDFGVVSVPDNLVSPT
ncbi:unnamed protein product, partial [Polarella glacialis]